MGIGFCVTALKHHQFTMKAVLVLAVFACLAALALGSRRHGYYKPGFRDVYDGIATPYNNAERQKFVNARAEKYDAGTGTARKDGVPGTGRDFGYKYGYDRRYDGYGYDRGYDGYDGH